MTRLRLVPVLSLLFGAAGVAACSSSSTKTSNDGGPADGAGDAGSSATTDGPATDGAVATTSNLTYVADIAPILSNKCVKCHQAEGIGPFALDTYENVKKRAPLVAVMTAARKMPPYLVTHDGTCGNFEDGEALTDGELAKIQEWTKGDLKQGDPTVPPLPLPKVPGIDDGVAYKTPELRPVAQGGATAQFDEYRCFPVAAPTPMTKDSFITAYDVVPGTASIVHHVLTFLVDPAKVTASGKTNAQVMKDLDATDPDRIGWPCFGMAGDGVEVEAVPVTWAPGQGPVTYPGNVGIRQKATDQVIIQVHYNLSDPKLEGLSDSTTVRLRYADTVERRAIFLLSDGLLETLGRKAPDMPDILAPGQASVKYTWTKTIPQLGLDKIPYVDLLGVMPHMHQRGHKKTISIISGGAPSCAAKVEDWDFNWQKLYFYKGTPTRLTADSAIKVECDYDTSKDTMPVYPGWGTRNEMCIAIMMLALPPGV